MKSTGGRFRGWEKASRGWQVGVGGAESPEVGETHTSLSGQLTFTAHRDGMWENKITTRDSVVSPLVLCMCPEGLAKLITLIFQRCAISDAKREQTGSLTVKTDLCQQDYGPGWDLPRPAVF